MGAGGGSAQHSEPQLKNVSSLLCSLLTDAVHRLVVYYGDSCTISHSTVSACEGTAMQPAQHAWPPCLWTGELCPATVLNC